MRWVRSAGLMLALGVCHGLSHATAAAFGAREGAPRSLDNAAEDPQHFQLRAEVTSLEAQLAQAGVHWVRDQSAQDTLEAQVKALRILHKAGFAGEVEPGKLAASIAKAAIEAAPAGGAGEGAAAAGAAVVAAAGAAAAAAGAAAAAAAATAAAAAAAAAAAEAATAGSAVRAAAEADVAAAAAADGSGSGSGGSGGSGGGGGGGGGPVTVHLGFLTVASAEYLEAIPRFMRRVLRYAAAGSKAGSSTRYVVHAMTDIPRAASYLAAPPGAAWRAEVHDLRELGAAAKARFGSLRKMVPRFSWAEHNHNFMYKVMAQHVLPPSVGRIIVLDLDMLVLADLAELWRYFDRFGPEQMIGMAPEGQPTYFPCGNTTALRARWPANAGGYQAYNGGLQLLDLAKMRSSALYNRITGPEHYEAWTKEHRLPWSNGEACEVQHWDLGDQDFLALLGAAQPSWFYTLPCHWNYQLCTFWQGRHNIWPPAYPEYTCPHRPSILHGNANVKRSWWPEYNTPTCEAFKKDIMGAFENKKHPGLFPDAVKEFCGTTEGWVA